MPGLLNRITGAALPLTASDVTTFVSGYALGLTASLTYGNLEVQPFQGLFVYPLDEHTTVIGFEAVIAKRVVTVQIKDKAKLQSGHFEASHARATTVTEKVFLDEDLERILFVVNLGTIAPMENVTVFISTSSELPTLPSGAVRVLLPAVCAPIVPHLLTKQASSSSPQTQGIPEKFFQKSKGPRGTLMVVTSVVQGDRGRNNKDKHCFSTWALDSWSKLCLASFLDTEVSNPMEYEFSFQLEIRGPCLLAGVESPTHEIRADASPSAPSAKSIIITLANKHTFDRPVEILIHPSEPHMPHVLTEKGDMGLGEFEQHLMRRPDFSKGKRKDSSADRKTEIIRKRLHKDIPHHSVVMLNFCPDLQSVQPNLRKMHGEFIFLIDQSSSMNGTNIHHVKEAMLVALKSLMPVCLFNVIGFGSTFKALFPCSQLYSEESLALACEHIHRMHADMGGTNLLAPLQWVVRQPMYPGHPRLLFLITDGAVSNTGKVLELARNHAFSTRCYSFGIGSSVCHRLVQGLATVSKGSAEFLAEGERLQPKMVKSLKKAMAPVLSDVTVEWIFPETTEVLISPVSTSSLFPGERLVGYGIVCDASLYISNPTSEKKQRCGFLQSQESSSSVFYQSHDEDPCPHSGDCAAAGCSGTPPNQKPAKDAQSPSGDSASNSGLGLSQRRRAYSTNQIANHKPSPRIPTISDPTMAAKRYPLRKAKLQDLTHQSSSDTPRWQIDLQPLLDSGHDLSQGPKLRGPGARRPSLLPQDCQPILSSGQETPTWSALKKQPFGFPRKPASEPPHHPSSFETGIADREPLADWEPQASPSRPSTPGPVLGKAVVRGLRDNQLLQWEVSFELGLPGPEPSDQNPADLWSGTFHHLAARAIIRDFEQLAERQGEIEQGSSRRYQMSAVHTSKACNVISKYTAFVPVDMSKRRYLPMVVGFPNSGPTLRAFGPQVLSRSWRNTCAGFGRSPTELREDSAAGGDRCQSLKVEQSPSEPAALGREKLAAAEGPLRSLATNTLSSLKTSESLFGSRLNLNTSRLLTRAAKGFLGKPPTKAPDSTQGGQSFDYIPLVSLQLASGAFQLNQAFCKAIQIPMEKLQWTSPFTCHRVSLSTRQAEPKASGPLLYDSHSPPHPSYDSFSPEPLAMGRPDWEARAATEPTGKLWATVVALAWLEHSSAPYFVEWELVAAKASSWLEQQEVPEGRTQAALKAAARQLFVLLRHWDETLEFNMLCYNPNYM